MHTEAFGTEPSSAKVSRHTSVPLRVNIARESAVIDKKKVCPCVSTWGSVEPSVGALTYSRPVEQCWSTHRS